MDKKVILYLGGGSMSGIFGAGIVTRLQEADVYERVEAVYGASAGLFSMACFLSGQTRRWSSIYYEDLIKDFILPAGILSGLSQRFWNRFISPIPPEKMHNAINIDYLMKIVKTNKRLDIQAIQDNSIPAFVKLFNMTTHEIEYVDFKRDILIRMQEGASVIPYYFPADQEYIDGEIVSPFGFDCLRKRHPNSKIVMCINHSPDRIINGIIRKTLEGMVATIMFEKVPFVKIFIEKIQRQAKELNKVYQDPNAILVHPPEENQTISRTTNPVKLKATYEMGIKKADEILEFIGK